MSRVELCRFIKCLFWLTACVASFIRASGPKTEGPIYLFVFVSEAVGLNVYHLDVVKVDDVLTTALRSVRCKHARELYETVASRY